MQDLGTLPDLLRPGLRAVSVGLNPSPVSAASGVYFANPRNRFWPALRMAGFIPPGVVAGHEAMAYLLHEVRLGFTDVVKRSTPGAGSLRAADFKRDAPQLLHTLERLAPPLVWFHGKVAYNGFRRYALGARGPVAWGEQRGDPLGFARVFLTPNPSPANAAHSLEELADWYRRVKQTMETLGS